MSDIALRRTVRDRPFMQVSSCFSQLLNLHNLSEEISSAQLERAVRIGEVGHHMVSVHCLPYKKYLFALEHLQHSRLLVHTALHPAHVSPSGKTQMCATGGAINQVHQQVLQEADQGEWHQA